METPISPEPDSVVTPVRCGLKIFGTGTAGVALLTQLRAGEFLPAQFVAVDLPGGAGVAEVEKIEICKSLLGGHGAHRAEPGKVELEGQCNAVKLACSNCDTVFILAGLGGRTGSWMSSAVARAAREAGAMVFAFVTLPFDCEGSVRFSKARQALERLAGFCDFVFTQPHQDGCAHHEESTSLVEAYAPSTRRLLAGVRHVAAALTGSTIMGIGFTDLCAMLRERGASVVFAVGGNEGANRAGAVVEELLAHPRLQSGKLLGEAETAAVSIVGAQDLRMADVNKVMSELGNHWQGTSHLLSASVGHAAQGPLSALLLIVTQEAAQTASRLSAPAGGTKPASEASAFDTHYLSAANETKNPPRFTTAPGDTATGTASRNRGGRTRSNNASRMRQGQLPLDIANKGRFEKSEPTIHKGEDLDVPTFIRRGVVLN